MERTQLSGVQRTDEPTSDIDLWSDESLSNPYAVYKQLRDFGPAVWMTKDRVWAITRHSEVREALQDGKAFSSSRGCMLEDSVNEAFEGIMLCSDDPDHRKMRVIFSRPLMPRAVEQLKDRLAALAERRVGELLAKGSFDAVTELAHFLPLSVVTDLVGLGEEGKRKMLAWASGIFNVFGPMRSQRTVSGLKLIDEAFTYLQALDRNELDPHGWGAALFDAADNGALTHDTARAMLMDYLGPALDTTINGLSSAIWLFARHPDQWTMLRREPGLLSQAIDEVLRMESPIRGFFRYLTCDRSLGGVTLPAGSRALILYASANRDERRYPDADCFDILRNPRDYLAFGYGTHICAGMHLAKLEIATVLRILARDVIRIHIVEEEHGMHNTLRGLSKLVVRCDLAPAQKQAEPSKGGG